MDPRTPQTSAGSAAGRWDADGLEARIMLDAIRADMFDRGGATKVGRFELRRLLGRGAFGSVYLAYDPTLERKVAVKVLDALVRQPAIAQGCCERRERLPSSSIPTC